LQKFKQTLCALGALAVLAGCQTTSTNLAQKDEVAPPSNPLFAGEMSKFNAQFPNAKAMRYEEESLAFNNKEKLDAKGNCHELSKYPVTIVLVLDAKGKVTSSTTDVENSKAACFREAYASAQFPSPPFASYRKPIRLR
jgi:hypothetical protein